MTHPVILSLRLRCLKETSAQGLVPPMLSLEAPTVATSASLPASQVLLQTSPYHVDSLLQLSDACRFQDDQEMARDLVGESCSHWPRCSAHAPSHECLRGCGIDAIR